MLQKSKLANPLCEAVRQLLSPPLAGGDKGEGETKSSNNMMHLFHPHPDPPPSRGRGIRVVGQPRKGDLEWLPSVLRQSRALREKIGLLENF